MGCNPDEKATVTIYLRVSDTCHYRCYYTRRQIEKKILSHRLCVLPIYTHKKKTLSNIYAIKSDLFFKAAVQTYT
jgi:hypothetical protein